MNRLAELLRELKNHVGETYNTLDKGSTGKNIRHDANALAKTLKSSFPMLEKDPQYVGAEDLINSGFGVMPLSTKLPATAFSEAHALAQKNAALPIEQGGLGLHPDNTAMERARALGFDVDNPVYHGTNADFNEFNPAKSSDHVQYMNGVFTADNPAMAANYGDIVMPLVQKKGITLLDKRNARLSGKPQPEIDTIYDKSKGIHVTSNPQNIRSRFAAFDPMQKNSANILASLLLGIGLTKDEK